MVDCKDSRKYDNCSWIWCYNYIFESNKDGIKQITANNKWCEVKKYYTASEEVTGPCSAVPRRQYVCTRGKKREKACDLKSYEHPV